MLKKGMADALREPLEFLAKIDQRKRVILIKKAQHQFFAWYEAFLTNNFFTKNRCWKAVFANSTGVRANALANPFLGLLRIILNDWLSDKLWFSLR